MKILGAYCSHDANVSIYDTDLDKLWYFKAERIYGIKHHGYNKNHIGAINFIKNCCEKINILPDIVVFTDGGRTELGACQNQGLYEKHNNNLFFEKNIIKKSSPVYCVDHHYAHILSCWPIKKTEEVDIGVALDNWGDHLFTGRIISNPSKPHILYDEKRSTIGKMLIKIGQETMGLTGLKLDIAGKVMGAQAYGSVSEKILNLIDKKTLFSDIGSLWLESYPKNTKFGDKIYNDWLATMHYLADNYIQNIFEKICKKDSVVAYSGGIAQNTVINYSLLKIYNNLIIPPHCYDGGLSLGCIELARILYNLPQFSNQGFPYWQEDNCEEKPTTKTISEVARRIADGEIMGWFQGRGEVGPRALGNRSILMDPRSPDGKNILNQKVKNREHWRPYSPSVLEEEAREWFEINKISPFMLYAVLVKKEKAHLIPSVVHVDNTSRVQTVSVEQNECFHQLIKEFYKLTGVPMLLNTSLNLGGSPIFSSRSQCLQILNNTSLDAICIGNKIISKFNLF
jgi:carbamoyltransferase